MMLKDKVAQTFAEVGPVGEFCLVDEFTDELLWNIAIDGADVSAELDEGRGIIVLSADLGRQPDDAATSLTELALLYNHGWPDSGGAHLSLDGAGGTFWLLMDLPAEIETEPLASGIKSFAGKAAAWRQIVAGPVDAPGDHGATLNVDAIRA